LRKIRVQGRFGVAFLSASFLESLVVGRWRLKVDSAGLNGLLEHPPTSNFGRSGQQCERHWLIPLFQVQVTSQEPGTKQDAGRISGGEKENTSRKEAKPKTRDISDNTM
jgi:hypothetical protein